MTHTPTTSFPSTSGPRAADRATGHATAGRDRRTTVFRITGVLILLAILSGAAGVIDLLGPWVQLRDADPGITPELHRWHQADISALVTLVACGSLLASLRRPRIHPVAVQAVVLSAVLLAVGALVPFNPEALVPSLAVAVLVVATYPDRGELLAPVRLRVRSPLGLVALVAVPPLLWNAAVNLDRQLGGGGEHAELSHWMGSAVVAIGLAAVGLLAASRRPGSRSVAVVVAVAYTYLGVAALTIPHHDGSWGRGGAVAALAAGAAFAGAAWIERRRGD